MEMCAFAQDAGNPPPPGLSAGELAVAAAELRARVVPSEVLDVGALRERDDLVLWLHAAAEPAGKLALHLVPGSRRGRVTLTARRFARADFATGPHLDTLRARLAGSTLVDLAALPDERIARLTLQRGAERSAIVVELFGNRGLWVLLNGDDRIVVLSRRLQGKDRELRPGAPWQPPAPRAAPQEPAARFQPPALAAIDALFTAADQRAEADAVRAACSQALARAQGSMARKAAGLEQQLAQGEEAPRLRARADLMLAYAFSVPRGASVMRVPDPDREGEHLELPLQQDQPVVAQAQALYDRARRLQDALAVSRRRLDEVAAARLHLDALAERLAAADAPDALLALREELRAGRLLPAAAGAAAPRPTARAKVAPAEAYRRFVSLDGAEILCGKTNEQNDRLTLRTARGNDVWLHVGRGHAGSHVVVRVPRGKSASLETLLDAAAIAVHFSKARGAGKAEVVYTQAKHVRKAKGAPAGAVLPHHTKTLFVREDPARLQRLLATMAGEA